jgi:hypothetical protein
MVSIQCRASVATSAWAIFYFTRWGGFMPSQAVYWPVPGFLINMGGRRIVQLKPLFISTAPQGLIGDDVFQNHLGNEAYPERADTFFVFKKRGLRRARS